jgi:hypothetical protein
MIQAVSRRYLKAEPRVHARVCQCGICCGQISNGTGCPPNYSAFPCQYHSTVAVHTHMSFGGYSIGLFVATIQRFSLTPLT